MLIAVMHLIVDADDPRETQRHRTHAEVARFFDGLELLEPGVVVVPQWRPQSRAEAEAHSGMRGGVGRRA
jgi:predicted secreted Zn-dependent protease